MDDLLVVIASPEKVESLPIVTMISFIRKKKHGLSSHFFKSNTSLYCFFCFSFKQSVSAIEEDIDGNSVSGIVTGVNVFFLIFAVSRSALKYAYTSCYASFVLLKGRVGSLSLLD
jgi:hypothetical protein